MAKHRTNQTALSKSFERTSQLIYLVGQDLTIQYANPALANWLGIDPTELLGAKLAYGSGPSPSDTESQLNGICPPLELIAEPFSEAAVGQDFFVTTGKLTAGEVQPRWRKARAIQIAAEESNSRAVLVMASCHDLAEPPSIDRLTLVANELHTALSEIRQRAQLCYKLDNLVGTSSFAHRVRRQTRLATGNPADVLILGPPGSGKEFLARTIHAAGEDTLQSDLVPVQCPLADQELLQSVVQELLKKQQRSRSSQPDRDRPRDTLLLLDVDRLPAAAQAELWGFLRLPKFTVRIIATASVDLKDLARAGKFESELALALGTLSIELLPLAERAEDIPLLAQAILEKRNPQRARQFAGFDKSALQMLVEFRWPGNLDELTTVIREAAAQAQSSLLSPHDLPKTFRDQWRAQQIGRPIEMVIELETYLESIERELLLRAVDQAKGNKTKAAKLLSLSRAKLLRRLQFFQLGAGPELDQLPLSDAESTETELLSPDAFEEIE